MGVLPVLFWVISGQGSPVGALSVCFRTVTVSDFSSGGVEDNEDHWNC